MQNYMISMRKKIGVTPSEIVEDRAAKDFRSIVREKLEQNEQQKTTKWIYAASIFLVLVVLVIGVTTINNYDKMQSVQEALNVISENVTAKGEDASEQGKEHVSISQEAPEENEESMETSGDAVISAEDSQETSEEPEDLSDDMYVVKKGDTLAGISKKMYGDTSHVDAICRMNGLENGNLIYIGQNLLLP